ncbi:glutamine-hydrolyzing carbamoyl-phosphate synthase small subunit [Janthinobacterium sp.]|uniref:glutamine-hydrolyzing carbamoyl-phosphate synthase small subunit n=1 Tax=Janthinobacterium sp. TaxID=1871054 RepID=UPI00293D96D6|nr:glutamine-hydrolyzing carbamoyl-phosphate synthase small subunit [Janthinobacterium sp.]
MLAFADGPVFRGVSIGAPGHTFGEVVFNTAMTGYQEILTDPSYSRQIVTLTCPHIGNTGVNEEDAESGGIAAAGLVIKNLPLLASNFRATRSLSDYLKDENIVAIAGVDTRQLTRLLRERGAQSGAIVAGTDQAGHALTLARSFAGLAGLDLVREVSTREPYEWRETEWQLGRGHGRVEAPRCRVVAIDYGVKRNILRMLAGRGCRVTVLPAHSSAAQVLAHHPDGVFLGNGPGDPAPCGYAIDACRELIEHGVPTFGICFGHQIMALASGGRTRKMKFGHHGANHPVQDLDSGQVMITAQNHGFAVELESLPANCRVTHLSLFDGTLQGFARTDRPAFSFQGHPEGAPGPRDIGHLFDRFVTLMERYKNA